MTSKELKTKYFQYFEARDHKIIDSASLIPDNDPTVLFTTAGMHPLVPFLMGEKHPEGNKLVSVQKCLRTGDIDEVGDTTHHTFFEMLGNWSLGDYFKEDAIKYSLEFLLGILKLDKKKIAVSVFGGDDEIPRDEESAKIWQDLGIQKIAYLGKKDNWWGPAGETGPCGPDTEMFYWTGADKAPEKFDPEDNRWVEIWNDVLMEYNKKGEGQYEKLRQRNVDTGMGLERTLAVLNGLDDNYRTELFWPIIQKIEDLSGKKYEDDKRSFRIVADHIRTAVFILGDSKAVTPSNKDQGYVLRRIIRRAIRFAKQINIEDNFCQTLAMEVIKIYKTDYPELEKNQDFILDELDKEENKFRATLNKGLKILQTELKAHKMEPGDKVKIYMPEEYTPNELEPKFLFNMYQTYGFPFELAIEEIQKNRNLSHHEINELKIGFDEELNKHQELSRTASAGMFKGGLADDSYNTKRHHTAAHLLLEALRQVLGDHVEQRGSNINEDRIRFDFSHGDKMTDEQKQQVEDIVNKQIDRALPVHFEEMDLTKAKEIGATGVFEHKYGDKVKVYFMGDFSKEICGGPHVDNTSELKHLKIKKEESSSAGVRRIKAVLN